MGTIGRMEGMGTQTLRDGCRDTIEGEAIGMGTQTLILMPK